MATRFCPYCCKEVKLKKNGTFFKHGHTRLGLYKLDLIGCGYFLGSYKEDKHSCNGSGTKPLNQD